MVCLLVVVHHRLLLLQRLRMAEWGAGEILLEGGSLDVPPVVGAAVAVVALAVGDGIGRAFYAAQGVVVVAVEGYGRCVVGLHLVRGVVELGRGARGKC